MKIRYPATIERQSDGAYLVRVVDFPDTFTEGRSRGEALANAAEVLAAMLAWRLDEAREVPAPSPEVKRAHYVALDAGIQAAMLRRLARRGQVGGRAR